MRAGRWLGIAVVVAAVMGLVIAAAVEGDVEHSKRGFDRLLTNIFSLKNLLEGGGTPAIDLKFIRG